MKRTEKKFKSETQNFCCGEAPVTFGDILRAAMEDKDMGVRQLASMTGLDRRIIQRALNGREEPRVGVLEKIVAALEAA